MSKRPASASVTAPGRPPSIPTTDSNVKQKLNSHGHAQSSQPATSQILAVDFLAACATVLSINQLYSLFTYYINVGPVRSE